MRTEEKRIYLSSPHMSGREYQYVQEAFESNWIAPLGPNVNGFEEDLADCLEVKGAAALSSGTAALHLALLLEEVGRGDRVFCSALTFVATANPILYVDAEPVFIDAEPGSWNMSPTALKRALEDAELEGRLPKAVIVVNLYGQSADMVPLLELCTAYGVPLIEDAAESLGATYKGKVSGSFGKYGILSFNGNKIITTSGGGALVSDDLEALKRARFLATQARQPARHYEHTEIGYNYRLSNVLAGIGRGQLEVLEERVEARRNVFERYQDAFREVKGFEFMPEADYGRSTRWLTVLTVEPGECGFSRDDIIDALEKENIEARPVWKPMQLQPLYEGCKFYPHQEKDRGTFHLSSGGSVVKGVKGVKGTVPMTQQGSSVSADLFERGICLPSGSNLTEEGQERVIVTIRGLLRQS